MCKKNTMTKFLIQVKINKREFNYLMKMQMKKHP